MPARTLYGAHIGTLDVEIVAGVRNVWPPETVFESSVWGDHYVVAHNQPHNMQVDAPPSAFHHPWRLNIERLRVDITSHKYGSTTERVLGDLMMHPGAHAQDEVWYSDPDTQLRTLRQIKSTASPEQMRPNQRLIVGCREDPRYTPAV